ncbi:hypothetical protein [Glaciimonas sp. PCH181]|uniref:hypothetical protein n=1 Tax=Glaciimonas sp. PCH181 TaxID=2133943 RepID=UPI000D367E6C|nr:hypothetical protein [Glaciimonas sp. PCH181]PUA19606.1 hypothetical protein C7W93_07110 [Glaciimonas sp. PCH181]
MKIDQQISAIECFHGRVQSDKARQHLLILSKMRLGCAYTGQELSHMTDLTPNIISARLFELRALMQVERLADRRACPHSGVSVFAHRKLPQQMVLV